jgi:hypothetical protein
MTLLKYFKTILHLNSFIDLENKHDKYHVESEYKNSKSNPDGSIEYEILLRIVINKR